MFDKILILVDGKLCYDGPPSDIKQKLDEFNFTVPRNQPPLELFLELIDKGSVRVEMENALGNNYPTTLEGIEKFE